MDSSPLEWGYLVAIAAGVFAGVVVIYMLASRKKRLPDPRGRWPYRIRPPLMPPEQALFLRLQEAFPGFVVLAQVRLSRLLSTGARADSARWKEYISRMSVDYVICTPDFKILGVVELETAQPGTEQRVADLVKARALQDARVPLVRWELADGVPDVARIHARFAMLAKTTGRRARTKKGAIPAG
jgi:hypothetical protein